MSDQAERNKTLEDLRKRAAEDGALVEVLEFLESAPVEVEEPKILMPYVNAPILSDCAWD
jgi:hypothetical protein